MKIFVDELLTSNMYWCNSLQQSFNFLHMRKMCRQYLTIFSLLSYDQQFDNSGKFAHNLEYLDISGYLHTMELTQVWFKSCISLISIQDTDSC